MAKKPTERKERSPKQKEWDANKERRRATKAEVALRVQTVYGLLCDGKSRAKILLVADEMWGLCESSTDDYLAKARKMLDEDCRMSREAFMAEALAGYRSIREQAERRGQLMCAKTCLDSMVELTSIKK